MKAKNSRAWTLIDEFENSNELTVQILDFSKDFKVSNQYTDSKLMSNLEFKKWNIYHA